MQQGLNWSCSADTDNVLQQREDDQTPVSREEPSAQEDEDVEQPEETAERRHVDALLEISEETSRKDLEPYDYHCYSSWEDVVCGWARVAPLSCILMTQNTPRKPKQKEANNLTPLSANPTPSTTVGSARIAEQHSKSHAGLHKKPPSLSQQTRSLGQTEFAVPNTPQKNTTHLLLQTKTDEDGLLRQTPSQFCPQSPKYFALESRSTKPPKHSPKPKNIVIPIKNITFLPPIKPLQLNPRFGYPVCKGKKVPEAKTLEENIFTFDKRSGTRGARVGTVAASGFHMTSGTLDSAYQGYQHPLYFPSALHVSVPKNHHVPVSS